MSSEDDLQEPLLERLSATPELEDSTKTSKKRKRGAVEQGAKKVAKKSKAKKGKSGEKDDNIDVEAGINKAFAHMDNQLLADYVAQRTRKYESDLSSVELEDKYLPGMAPCLAMHLLANRSGVQQPSYKIQLRGLNPGQQTTFPISLRNSPATLQNCGQLPRRMALLTQLLWQQQD